jgi:DNA mismatch endonuclease (patch repair protein)
MSRIRSRGNKTTELRFMRCCRMLGITGWRRGSKLFGKPDFVFAQIKLAVFIDGDFWHGNPRTSRLPKSNAEYWTNKIWSNRRRDKLVTKTLTARGWRVFRVWESDLRNDLEAVMAKLRMLV